MFYINFKEIKERNREKIKKKIRKGGKKNL